MEKLCCVLDTEENYAVRMATNFNTKKVFPYNMRAFSEMESYLECAKENEVVLLLVADNAYKELLNTSAGMIIRLSDQSQSLESDDGMLRVGKYQAIDSIIRDVISLYESEGNLDGVLRGATKSKMICVYSPNGNCGKTTLALLLAHEKGKKHRVLYINLEEFSGLGEMLPERKGNLSDALFYYHTGIGNGMGKYLTVICQGDGFDYLPPTLCATDIPYLSSQMISDFVEQITSLGNYEYIIVDVGNLVKEPWKLLAKAEVVLMPLPDSPHREKRHMDFEKFLHFSGMEQLLSRLVTVSIVRDESLAKGGKIDFLRLSNSEYGRAVSQLEL